MELQAEGTYVVKNLHVCQHMIQKTAVFIKSSLYRTMRTQIRNPI